MSEIKHLECELQIQKNNFKVIPGIYSSNYLLITFYLLETINKIVILKIKLWCKK